MRICSLLPSATEIVSDLGLQNQLVGISHECNWPPDIEGKTCVTIRGTQPILFDPVNAC